MKNLKNSKEDDFMKLALYRKHRPVRFEDVVGQEDTINNLKNQIRNNNSSHAYEFSGTRGTGKTSTGKILARVWNCENPINGEPCNTCPTCKDILEDRCLDVVEMDAASNNGVDNIRELIDNAKYMPSRCKYKVYIIDEVHMLSTGAFNALLKTLEEPPLHVRFILATTEPHKIPPTIRSRCQKFHFKRVSNEAMIKRLQFVCQQESASVNTDGLVIIAQNSDGAMRDALSLLDQCISLHNGPVGAKEVSQVLGLADTSLIFSMAKALIGKDVSTCLSQLRYIMDLGKSFRQFSADLFSIFRDIMLFLSSRNESIIEGTSDYKKAIVELAAPLTHQQAIEMVQVLSQLNSKLRYEMNPLTIVELTFINLCIPSNGQPAAGVSVNSQNTSSTEVLELKKQIESLRMEVAQIKGNGMNINQQSQAVIQNQGEILEQYKKALMQSDKIIYSVLRYAKFELVDNVLHVSFEVPGHYLVFKRRLPKARVNFFIESTVA